MRQVICDRCGYTLTNGRSADEMPIESVKIYFAVTTDGQPVHEENTMKVDLCKACRNDLPFLFEDITEAVTLKVLSWLNKEDKSE